MAPQLTIAGDAALPAPWRSRLQRATLREGSRRTGVARWLCLRKVLLIQGVVAAMAATATAHASIEAASTRSTNASVSGPTPVHLSSPALDTASPAPESTPAAGAAIFSPFAVDSATPARRQPARDRSASADSADPTFSVAAGLAALAALAYLLRRANR